MHKDKDYEQLLRYYDGKLKLDSYWFVFEPTGNKSIDTILAAVAAAGKAYHNTDQWACPDFGTDGRPTYCDLIQWAANKAAKESAGNTSLDEALNMGDGSYKP